MNKPESIFVKNLPYLCLIGVIALGLITIVGSNGCDDGDGTPGGHVGGGVEITWVEESGLTIATAQYSESGFLTAYMCYSYFEVTGGSGEVEISVDLESSTGDSLGSQTTSFDVEPPPCPKANSEPCGEPTKKRVSRTSFVLKGGGWYKDGYS